MEEINFQKYNLTFEIQYVQFMVELLKPYVEFRHFNTTENIVDIVGASVPKKELKMFLKKENGIQELINVTQFIHFIQIEFPKIIDEKSNIYHRKMHDEKIKKDDFDEMSKPRGPYGGRGRMCPEGMDKNEYLEKTAYYDKQKNCPSNYDLKLRDFEKKINVVDKIRRVYWKRIETIEGVIRFLNNVKDHYIKT